MINKEQFEYYVMNHGGANSHGAYATQRQITFTESSLMALVEHVAKDAIASQKEQAETVDERAEFEKVFKLPDYVEWRENQQQYLTMPDEHRNDEFNGAWEGWQAGRAQLTTAKPSTVPRETNEVKK